jgi:energy-coupling factor transporter ATP-binding protein EcfA2
MEFVPGMRTLHRSIRSIERGGTALPVPFPSWADAGISIRRGEVSMIAGPPGAGKSTIALAIAVAARVPTLYVSADSHEATMALRTIAMITKTPQSEVEQHMSSSPDWAAGIVRDYAGHIRWMFDASPTLNDLEDEVNVYREVMGENPSLVVIDNAVDITHESGDEFSSLRSLMREVKWWARDTTAAFLILHHTSESYSSDPCPPRSALHGKIAQIPSLVLTVASEQPGLMGVAAVKNRYGPADASGHTALWLDYHPSTMQLKDIE